MLISPSPEEPATVAGSADAGFAVSDEVCAVASRTAGADTGLVPSESVAGGPDGDSVTSDEVRPVAAGADCGCISVLLSVSPAPGEDLSRAFVNVCCSRLRERDVSELRSGAPVFLVTAGFAPNALLVSSSSCPVTGSLLRVW